MGTTPAKGMKVCPHCGEEVKQVARRCKHCGAAIVSPAQAGVMGGVGLLGASGCLLFVGIFIWPVLVLVPFLFLGGLFMIFAGAVAKAKEKRQKEKDAGTSDSVPPPQE